ncbi:MAG TPA: type 1 glutamine amidotransferase domain-containing protein [Cytophagaceae bacterium]
MERKLEGKRVAVLVENGFEQVELTEPVKALKEQGAKVDIISPHDKVKGWNYTQWGDDFEVDVKLDKAVADQYNAILLPGGVMNPDKLRMNSQAITFIKHFMESGKPVAAICHGPWTLIETGLLSGRKVTSYPSIKTDLINAGAKWIDQDVVTDLGIVTSRKPSDIPAFNKKMIEEIAEGVHKKRQITPLKRPWEAFSSEERNRLNENIDTRNWDEYERMMRGEP